MFDRRTILIGGTALLFDGSVARASEAGFGSLRARFEALEGRSKGRLGAYVLDLKSGRGVGWREHARFAHCSSFKMSLAAMVLSKADRSEIDLNETLHWTAADMLGVSPVTSANLSTDLSIKDLARATLVTSDNTAANVLLRRFGGPEQLTRFWRLIGDSVSRLDRYEPALNVTPPGTALDTTTPAAMAATLARLISGNALSISSREQLKNWMRDVKTGRDRIRSGFPATWESGDKTGTGIGKTKHTFVDLTYGGPVGRAPLIVTAYFEPARLVEPMDPVATSTLAEVGRIAASSLNGR